MGSPRLGIAFVDMLRRARTGGNPAWYRSALGLLALASGVAIGAWSQRGVDRAAEARGASAEPSRAQAIASQEEEYQCPCHRSAASSTGPGALALADGAPLAGLGARRTDKDIRKLSQHFLDTHGNSDPWIFLPRENIKEISTSEHPGLVTIWEAGKGRDIKGVLKDPIAINDYPLPWEFHMGLVQNALGTKGLSEKQINYAIGLNLALTFSDPATWPKDRTKRPPQTHSVQLFVVHLGNQGEIYRLGVPQLRRSALNFGDHSPEAYLVYGRGDLDPNLNGNWKMGYSWVGPDPVESGTWSKDGGPANHFPRFRVSMLSPGSLQIGVGFGQHAGWRYRNVDVSRFGKITGVWEIGPIFSCDRWIADVLPRELQLNEPVWLEPLKLRQGFLPKPERADAASLKKVEQTFHIDPPDPAFQYYVDYAVFYGNGPENVEHLSDDFDVPGFLADQKYYIEGDAWCETHSNPGYLTATLYGVNSSWAMCPILAAGESGIDFTKNKKPPFEIEIGVITPDDVMPWNLWWTLGLYDEKGKNYPWSPGLKNVPGEGVKFFNQWNNDPVKVIDNPVVNPQFDPPLPQSVLAHKPLYMLIQVADDYRVRVGFKTDKTNPWTFSKAFDSSSVFGKIVKLAYPCIVSFQGRGTGARGWGAGNYPGYQKFKFDYWYYRYGLSK